MARAIFADRIKLNITHAYNCMPPMYRAYFSVHNTTRVYNAHDKLTYAIKPLPLGWIMKSTGNMTANVQVVYKVYQNLSQPIVHRA